ncbi:MAG: hypothetical protein LBH00_06990 [Planctomycetaceae bacterium]|nr:hypothetical protein [Planctomycetaceae bacterium]
MSGEIKKQTGSEPFIHLNGSTEVCLADYWAWAHSELNSNTERSKLAEFLVALAMQCTDTPSRAQQSYDILTKEGIKIEVKTSAYLQTWEQRNSSSINFDIASSSGTGKSDPEYKRQADVYVFCVEKHQDKEPLNPLDVDQWDFYPVSTEVLNTEFGEQESVAYPLLQLTGMKPCRFAELRDAVLTLAGKK